MKRYLTYDDVNIVPKYSELESRGDVDLTSRFTKNIKLQIPIVSSPMDTVTEYDMAKIMMDLGGVGVVHRFMSIKKQTEIVEKLWAYTFTTDDRYPVCAAVGVTGDYLERAKELVKKGCNVILIDVAHGHHKFISKFLYCFFN